MTTEERKLFETTDALLERLFSDGCGYPKWKIIDTIGCTEREIEAAIASGDLRVSRGHDQFDGPPIRRWIKARKIPLKLDWATARVLEHERITAEARAKQIEAERLKSEDAAKLLKLQHELLDGYVTLWARGDESAEALNILLAMASTGRDIESLARQRDEIERQRHEAEEAKV